MMTVLEHVGRRFGGVIESNSRSAAAAFFVFIFLCLVGMSVWEYFAPGGTPRRGILGLDTTRGDRLFISLLGSAFVFLAWLGLMGTPPWGALSSRSSTPSRYSAGFEGPNSLSL